MNSHPSRVKSTKRKVADICQHFGPDKMGLLDCIEVELTGGEMIKLSRYIRIRHPKDPLETFNIPDILWLIAGE